MHHPYLAGNGYTCLRVDLRGSGDSEGVLTDEYLERELRDAEEVLAWMLDQTWCSGPIGMMRLSWGGFNALRVAAGRPPELGAVVAVCASDDRYAADVHYMGRCLLGDNVSWASTMFAYNPAHLIPPWWGTAGGRCGWTGWRAVGCGWPSGRAASVGTTSGGTVRSARTTRRSGAPS